MTPKEDALVRFATLQMENDSNVAAMRFFMDYCDVLNCSFGVESILFRINNARRMVQATIRLFLKDEKGELKKRPLTGGNEDDEKILRGLSELLSLLTHVEIIGPAMYRIAPCEFRLTRVSRMESTVGGASTQNGIITDSVYEMKDEAAPVNIL